MYFITQFKEAKKLKCVKMCILLLTILVCLCHVPLSGPSMDHERTLNWKLPHSTAILQHLSNAMLLDFNFREAFKKKNIISQTQYLTIMTPRTHYLR